MKHLHSQGLGTTPKQAEPLTPEDEEKMWASGVLGDHSPQALLDTMVFMCGCYIVFCIKEWPRTSKPPPRSNWLS